MDTKSRSTLSFHKAEDDSTTTGFGPLETADTSSISAAAPSQAGSSETFSQLYLLSVDPKTGATSVSFGETPHETVTLASGSLLIGGERFTVSGAPHNNGTYSYVGEAKVSGHIIGFTAFNQFGQEILFSNDSTLNHGANLVVLDGVPTTICFMSGTSIATPAGEVPVEKLEIGELVCTFEGEAKPIKWVGVQTISRTFGDPARVYPIRVAAGAFGVNVPSRDLLISPDHALLVGGVLVHASALINGTTVCQESHMPSSFVYYHIELDDHSLIIAENTPAETFVDNVERLGFDNWADHEALYPNADAVLEMDRPRAKSYRQVPYAVRSLLADRAQTLQLSTRKAA